MEDIDDYGVYAIYCIKNNSIYIGETSNIKRRWNEHLSSLKSNNHYNHSLQSDYNLYGAESFEFKVLNRISGESWYLNKAKCLVLEHAYTKYYKSKFIVYNVRDSMNDYLLYDEVTAKIKMKNAITIKKQILNILSSYICIKNDNLLLDIKYVGSLKQHFIINGIIPNNDLVYHDFANLIPKNIVCKRDVNYFSKKDGKIINVSFYLVKDIDAFNNYIYNNYKLFTSDNKLIILPTVTKLRKILLCNKIINDKFTSSTLKKLLITNNMLIKRKDMLPTEYSIQSNYIVKNGIYAIITPKGVKYIISLIDNKWKPEK